MADQYEPLGPMNTDPAPKPAAVQQSTPAVSQTPQNFFEVPPPIGVAPFPPAPPVPPQSPATDQKSIAFTSQTTQDPTFGGGQSSYGQTGGSKKTADGEADVELIVEGGRSGAQKRTMGISVGSCLFFILLGSLGSLALVMGWHE